MTPKISVLLCTARGDAGYEKHPEYHTIGKVVEDLLKQTLPTEMFELVVVDGVFTQRAMRHRLLCWGGVYDPQAETDRPDLMPLPFSFVWLPPRPSLAVWHRKVAISAYRNTGIAAARGELIVNLDDCCRLPPSYLETFWSAWSRHRVCVSPLWPESGDTRPPGVVKSVTQDSESRPFPGIYGFGSYPRETALQLNGYDEAYDGGQGLEDYDWSVRLHQAGVKQALLPIPGFRILAQTGHDPRAIDLDEPIVKCCNRAWHAQRVRRHVSRANTPELWADRKWLDLLVKPPCPLWQNDGTCLHHHGRVKCAYPKLATEMHPIAEKIYEEPPGARLELTSG